MISSNIIQWMNHHHVLMHMDLIPYGIPHMIQKPTSSKKLQQHVQIVHAKTFFCFLGYGIKRSHLKV
jgi:hypothetical protein